MRHRVNIALAAALLAGASGPTPAAAATSHHHAVPASSSTNPHPLAHRAAAQNDHSSVRDNIKRAQHALADRYGGYKLDQSWQGDDLLVVWQSDDGRNLLVQINSQTGDWSVIHDESPRR